MSRSKPIDPRKSASQELFEYLDQYRAIIGDPVPAKKPAPTPTPAPVLRATSWTPRITSASPLSTSTSSSDSDNDSLRNLPDTALLDDTELARTWRPQTRPPRHPRNAISAQLEELARTITTDLLNTSAPLDDSSHKRRPVRKVYRAPEVVTVPDAPPLQQHLTDSVEQLPREYFTQQQQQQLGLMPLAQPASDAMYPANTAPQPIPALPTYAASPAQTPPVPVRNDPSPMIMPTPHLLPDTPAGAPIHHPETHVAAVEGGHDVSQQPRYAIRNSVTSEDSAFQQLLRNDPGPHDSVNQHESPRHGGDIVTPRSVSDRLQWQPQQQDGTAFATLQDQHSMLERIVTIQQQQIGLLQSQLQMLGKQSELSVLTTHNVSVDASRPATVMYDATSSPVAAQRVTSRAVQTDTPFVYEKYSTATSPVRREIAYGYQHRATSPLRTIELPASYSNSALNSRSTSSAASVYQPSSALPATSSFIASTADLTDRTLSHSDGANDRVYHDAATTDSVDTENSASHLHSVLGRLDQIRHSLYELRAPTEALTPPPPAGSYAHLHPQQPQRTFSPLPALPLTVTTPQFSGPILSLPRSVHFNDELEFEPTPPYYHSFARTSAVLAAAEMALQSGSSSRTDANTTTSSTTGISAMVPLTPEGQRTEASTTENMQSAIRHLDALRKLVALQDILPIPAPTPGADVTPIVDIPPLTPLEPIDSIRRRLF